MDPPKRAPDWEKPVTLHLAVVRWTEPDESCHAFVPVLGIQVSAPRVALLEERIKSHVRLVLMGRRKRLSLRHLERIGRIDSIELGQMEVTAKLSTPREIATAQGLEKEEPSTLARLAEEMLPLIATTQKRDGQDPRLAEVPIGKALAPIAFEMESELTNLAEALTGPRRRSVLLVGPAGCGKTVLVRELARRRQELGFAQIPFWSTTGARLMSGPIGFGLWQERCQKLCQEAAKTNSIIHLGNLAELLEVGKARRGEQSVGSFLRPWIARGEVLAVAECTPEQLGAIARSDPHLLESFLHLPIPERTPEQARAILREVFDASLGKPEIDPRTTVAALDRLQQLHSRYAVYSANPSRSIRFLRNLLADRFPEKTIAEAEVTAAFSRETGLPPVLLDDQLPLDLDATRQWFATRLIGQDQAIGRIVDLLAMIKARLARPKKPLASFLFIGPTGTGKTELAKALAEFLFSDAGRLTRFDLNQFNDPMSVQRLIGGPLAGSNEGLLTARVREQPFSVILLDEFEKADGSFFALLLQILGEGRLTDAAGRVADFCNSVIVMTSNLGAQEFQRGPSGFQAGQDEARTAREHFTEAVRGFLRPEIFNRLDAIVPFRPLSEEIMLDIARRQIDLLRNRDGLRLRPIELQIDEEVTRHLARKGYDSRYGARPLKRALERELLKLLAAALLQYDESQPVRIRVEVVGDRLQTDIKAYQIKDCPPGTRRLTQPSEIEFAEAIAAQRRLVDRLKDCSAVGELENRLTMAEALARRLADAKWKSPEQQARLAALPQLQRCLADITALHDRAQHLETEALSFVYQHRTLERELFLPELNTITSERQWLARKVFRLTQENPDDIVLSVFGEDRGTTLHLAGAYYELAQRGGQVIAFEYFVLPPGARSSSVKLTRKPPEKLTQPFRQPPEKAIGVVMHLRGELFAARFGSEGGLHTFKFDKEEQACLVETRQAKFEEYQPPEGIDRKGGIKTKGVPLQRHFDREANEVKDIMLGMRPWLGVSLIDCLNELIEGHFTKLLEQVTN